MGRKKTTDKEKAVARHNRALKALDKAARAYAARETATDVWIKATDRAYKAADACYDYAVGCEYLDAVGAVIGRLADYQAAYEAARAAARAEEMRDIKAAQRATASHMDWIYQR